MSIYTINATGVTADEQFVYGSSRLGVKNRNLVLNSSLNIASTTVPGIGIVYDDAMMRGSTQYELSNHLGNVLATISDRKVGHITGGSVDYYEPEVLSAQDYYPFGMQMPGRRNNSDGYRYGFNGKENDNEVKGTGNQQDYGMRIYDARLGRFLSVDPIMKKFPELTPYQFASNTPIQAIDLDGLEKLIYLYNFTEDAVTRTKIDLPSAGPLGGGVLIKSDHGGVDSYYYGNEIPNSSIVSFKKAYEGIVIDKDGNHVGYKDSKGYPTIGYGHLIKKDESYVVGGKISESDAAILFTNDSKNILAKADELLQGFTLNVNQKNSLYDASFNMGPGKMTQCKEDGTKFSGENFFLQFMSGGEGIKKRRYAENLLYAENKYIHFDVIKAASTIRLASNAVDEQTGGSSPVTATGEAARIPDENN